MTWWTPWLIVALALGLMAGPLVAFASVSLPAPGARPGGRRIAGCTAAALALAAWSGLATPGPLGVAGAVLGGQLLLLAVLDGEHFWLPHRLTTPLGLTGLAQAALMAPGQVVERLIGAAAGFAVFWALAAGYRRLRGREGLGGGDVRLLAAAGAWVGWIGLPSVLVWAAGAGLVAVAVKLAMRRGAGAGDQVPFGVFLAIGLWLTWLYGPVGRG